MISELVAKEPNLRVVQWVDSIDEDTLLLGSSTIGGIKREIDKPAGSSRKNALTAWLEGDLLIRFTDRILSIDTRVMVVWGQLTADLEKQGRRMPAIAFLIAATCLQAGLVLVTRNESDFARSGVTVMNPWEQ